MPISPARVAAYEVLLRVERDRGYTSVLLPQAESNLSERDRSLCHQIVLGVLRRQYTLDEKIRRFSGNKKIDAEILVSLRMGAYQILFLDRVPDHSVVNDSVGLVQRARKSSAKGFVNAILRKIVTEGHSDDRPENLSFSTSHPQWLLDRWAKEYGGERAASLARANNAPPRLVFRITAAGSASNFEPPEGTTRSEFVDGAFVAEKMTATLFEAAAQGAIYFQDEASQFIASRVSLPVGGTLIDLCAAPGGKTTQIASRSDAFIVAGDIHQARVNFLRANAVRQCVSGVNVLRLDAEATLPFADESFDAILLDAPCSGTGTIRSNPEIRYYVDPEDIEQLSSKQLTILHNASKLLKPSGSLYYSTCSLERDENEAVIDAFLSSASGFSLQRSDVSGRFSTPEGFERTFPDRDNTDGFFLAVLVKH